VFVARSRTTAPKSRPVCPERSAHLAIDPNQEFLVQPVDASWLQCNIECQEACPVGTNCRGYLNLAAEGRFEEGYILSREPNPVAAMCAYVCSAPCERACRRGDRHARTEPSTRTHTSPRPDWARARGCNPLRSGLRRRGSDTRGSSCRRGTLPGTQCCTEARRRRQAEPGIPGWGRWPSGLTSQGRLGAILGQLCAISRQTRRGWGASVTGRMYHRKREVSSRR